MENRDNIIDNTNTAEEPSVSPAQGDKSPSFKIYEFSEENLYIGLSNRRCPPAEVASKSRASYLSGYLKKIGANTIIVEFDYTDHDYLDDFAAYYVRCFQAYERRCKRLHFFSESFDDEKFIQIIRETSSPEEQQVFRDSYLGFIVARPLPDAIIGRTVLKTYGSDDGRRNYTSVLGYQANLFGIELSVLSLAFQEQDTVLAACATVSLWSGFNKTRHLFGSLSPTPAEITRAATQVVHHSRPIPSRGLIAQQICNAIRQVGLEPEILHINPKVPLPSLMYAHLKMGIPVILGVEVEGVGLHAITVAGFSLQKIRNIDQEVGADQKCIPMIGLRINEFYAHDDQIGPFSRIMVKPQAGKLKYPVVFEGSWMKHGSALTLYPHVVIVPVYNKIRVTFNDVQRWLTRLTGILPIVLAPPTPEKAYEWDLYLTTTNEFKKSIKKATDLQSEILEGLLVRQHPKFIWRACLKYDDIEILELLFDATDMARSLPVYCATWYDDTVKEAVRRQLERSQLHPLLVRYLTEQFWQFLLDSTIRHSCLI